MREAVVNEDASRQWKHLSLVLQTAKRSRENQSVVVAFKLRPFVFLVRMKILLPKKLLFKNKNSVFWIKITKFAPL